MSSKLFHTLGRQHQLLANAGLHRRVAGIGNDEIFCFGPGMRKLVGAKIDKGLSDRQIFEELLREFGPNLVRPHLLP